MLGAAAAATAAAPLLVCALGPAGAPISRRSVLGLRPLPLGPRGLLGRTLQYGLLSLLHVWVRRPRGCDVVSL